LRFWQKIIAPFLGNSFAQAVFQNPSWLVGVSDKNYLRAIAFFPDPHMFSFYLGMLLPFSVSLYLESSNKNKRILFLFISIAMLITDTLTFSRGGYLGLLAGLAFTFFIFRKTLVQKFSAQRIAIASIIGLIIFITILFPNPISSRLSSSFDIEEGSNLGRLETWNQSIDVIRKNPWGVGLGNYPLEIKPGADYREPIYSHNLYLDIAAETGIINALIFIWLIIASIFSFMKMGKDNKFYLAGAVGLIIFSVHSIFETPLFSIHILPLFLIVIALSVTKNE
jgi:putative inorganic carbon (hco3(-)) transporter